MRHSSEPHPRPSGGHGDAGKMGGCGFNEEKMGVVLNDEGKMGVACSVVL